MDQNAPVLVTGASGYIASRIVQQLLSQGYTVHGTVRNPGDSGKYQFLHDLQEGTTGELKLFKADLLDEGSFDEAMKGCQTVIHTASPFVLNVKDPQRQLIDPALKGTRNVLHAATQTPEVRRVVLTSSVVAIFGDASESEQVANGTFTDQHWNQSSSLKHQPYAYSKTLAEKEAWKIAKSQSQWDLVTINPGFVMGPSLTSGSSSASLDIMEGLLKGKFKTGVPALNFGLVDVRDVAAAHIRAAQTPEAQGRYITCHRDSVSMLELAKAIEEGFPGKFKLPKATLPKFLLYIFGPLQGFSWKYVRHNIGFSFSLDNSKLKEGLQIQLRPWKKTLQDHARQMIDDGIVKA